MLLPMQTLSEPCWRTHLHEYRLAIALRRGSPVWRWVVGLAAAVGLLCVLCHQQRDREVLTQKVTAGQVAELAPPYSAYGFRRRCAASVRSSFGVTKEKRSDPHLL